MPAVPNNFALIRTLTAQLLDVRGPPFRLSINHNVGPPKNIACPLEYNFRHGRDVGIETYDRTYAVNWIGMALMKGYHVERLSPRRYEVVEAAHLRSARGQAIRRAEWEAMTPAQREAEDREIPF